LDELTEHSPVARSAHFDVPGRARGELRTAVHIDAFTCGSNLTFRHVPHSPSTGSASAIIDVISPEGQPESDPESGGTGPDAGGQGDRFPTGRRRMGGAGGSRSSPAGARGDSPEDRLDAAIEQINAAQSRRLPEEPPPASTNDDGKDW